MLLQNDNNMAITEEHVILKFYLHENPELGVMQLKNAEYSFNEGR